MDYLPFWVCFYCTELAKFQVKPQDSDPGNGVYACQLHLRRLIEALIGSDGFPVTVNRIKREES